MEVVYSDESAVSPQISAISFSNQTFTKNHGTPSFPASQGEAWLSKARPGEARPGKARSLKERPFNKARPGEARPGRARLGEAWQGEVFRRKTI